MMTESGSGDDMVLGWREEEGGEGEMLCLWRRERKESRMRGGRNLRERGEGWVNLVVILIITTKYRVDIFQSGISFLDIFPPGGMSNPRCKG